MPAGSLEPWVGFGQLRQQSRSRSVLVHREPLVEHREAKVVEGLEAHLAKHHVDLEAIRLRRHRAKALLVVVGEPRDRPEVDLFEPQFRDPIQEGCCVGEGILGLHGDPPGA